MRCYYKGGVGFAKYVGLALAAILLISAHTHADAQKNDLVSEIWMNILFNGQKIGFQYQKIERVQSGYKATSRAVMKLVLMDIPQDMSFSNITYLDHDKQFQSFVYLQAIQNQRQRTSGQVVGNKLHLNVEGAGGVSETTVSLPKGIRFADAVEFAFSNDLVVGKKITAPIYISSLRAIDKMTMHVLAKKKIKFRGKSYEVFVIETSLQGVKTLTYVTTDGVKLREDSAMGFNAVRTTEENVLKFAQVRVPITSLITFSLVTPDKPVESPDTIKEMSLTIGGLGAKAGIPRDQRQEPSDAIRRLDQKGKRNISIPVTMKLVGPVDNIPSIGGTGKVDAVTLKATPEIQSENRMIKKFAKDIVGDETNAWLAAKKINHWVFENIEKKFVDSFTAVDVLLSRQGECQSHTYLFTAFSRSVGIPTRISAGLVYSRQHKGFLYHAWPEVYVGQWVAMDPTLGQDIADPTHIKLTGGEPESQLKLMRFIGKISISIQSIRR